MSNEEMRELDNWIAEHVFKHRTHFKNQWIYRLVTGGESVEPLPRYTTNPADAFAVLEKCANELYKNDGGIECGIAHDEQNDCEFWYVSHDRTIKTVEAPTLPLAICLFAKQLFSK